MVLQIVCLLLYRSILTFEKYHFLVLFLRKVSKSLKTSKLRCMDYFSSILKGLNLDPQAIEIWQVN